MKFEGTKGPWIIREDYRYNYAYSIEKCEKGNRSIIALLNDQWICEEHGSLLSNACAIAAVPELIEALQICQRVLFEYVHGDETPEMCCFAEAEIEALNVLHKALGVTE